MPVFTVRIPIDGVGTEQKARIVANITAAMRSILAKKPEHTDVPVEEFEPEIGRYADDRVPQPQ